MSGLELIETIASATGLPKNELRAALIRVIQDKGYEAQTLTLKQVREVLAEYLQDTLLNAKKEYS